MTLGQVSIGLGMLWAYLALGQVAHAFGSGWLLGTGPGWHWAGLALGQFGTGPGWHWVIFGPGWHWVVFGLDWLLAGLVLTKLAFAGLALGRGPS